MDEETCIIERLNRARFVGVPFALRTQELRKTEACLVREVLQMLQGQASSTFIWDHASQFFSLKNGVYLSHASASSLRLLLTRFVNAASSLRRIDLFVQKVMMASSCNEPSCFQASPTLQAFSGAVSLKAKYLRKGAVEQELLAVSSDGGTSITLLGLLSSLSRLCAGSEFLEQIVNEAVPQQRISCDEPLSTAELGAQILSFLYDKMSEYCLVEDGEEEAYSTLLMLFAGTIQPLAEALNTWLHEGFLDDPFGELFFYANSTVAIEDAAFWQNAFCLRHSKSQISTDIGCKDEAFDTGVDLAMDMGMQVNASSIGTVNSRNLAAYSKNLACPNFLQHMAKSILSAGKSLQLLQHVKWGTPGNSSESNVILDCPFSLPWSRDCQSFAALSSKGKMESINGGAILTSDTLNSNFSSVLNNSGKPWRMQKVDNRDPSCFWPARPCGLCFQSNDKVTEHTSALCPSRKDNVSSLKYGSTGDSSDFHQSLVLPPLNDQDIYNCIFSDSGPSYEPNNKTSTLGNNLIDTINSENLTVEASIGTDYGKGSTCGSLLVRHAQMDSTAMERLFPASTVLPCSNEQRCLLDSSRSQSQICLVGNMSDCLEKMEIKVTRLPWLLVQACLIKPIQKQVENVGKRVLTKLMKEWRLMEELNVLRAIYLIGSGDLLQQFSSVLFNKLDRGEPWDDFYELNTILQESVRSSADGVLLPALDALVVMVHNKSRVGTDIGSGPLPLHISGRNLTFGIDILDSLSFVYRVSWPLELIINKNAIKKYNQVMTFLFKVKRAKFALDKACRWMWKDGVRHNTDIKQQLLLQQKLMHFVNTLHQYVMDRVLFSAWEELCHGMAVACSLDEVIACHDAYLVSIQRQCLVAPDKLWALISSRVKTILSLALDFYSIQRTLFGGGAAPAIKIRCQSEIARIGRQFEECIVFLLRVLSFKLNVGHFPHLAELVTRINYNFYYVSESGHLLTPIPETSRRVSQQVKVSV